MIQAAISCLLILGFVTACAAPPPRPEAQGGDGQIASAAASAGYVASRITPPPITREFRAAWIASVYNIDWPSRPGLPASRQQSELVAILDRVQALNMNAVILQVRPACDALYQSSIEPWSDWLTGTMGRSPGYDPLQFALQEAHARGIEVHAWFNPFRALASAKRSASADHVTRRHPDWIRRYEDKVWLDPGLPQVRSYSTKVIMDVVSRYDIDGVHIDDYFYPYPKSPKPGVSTAFPDSATYKKYGRGSDRDDWRRANINAFVSDLYSSIKAKKPWVKFGISPFGIWQPGVPRGVEATLDSYRMIYGDSRTWLRNGWCDYLSPQLYWPIRGEQSFSALLGWWDSQNVRGRHLWPGIASDRVGAARPASEQGRQIELTRASGRNSAGHIHWSWKPVAQNRRGLTSLLEKRYYQEGALVPAIPWSSSASPGAPSVSVRSDGRSMFVDWEPGKGSTPTHWIVQTRQDGRWAPAKIVASRKRGIKFELGRHHAAPEVISVTAGNRYGNVSSPSVVQRR